MIEAMSRQTRGVLLGLAGVALVVMLYDASAPWRKGTPVTPATTPALESSRSEIQRGLDKTPLVYPAQFVDALVTRLRDTLVVAVPASGGDPRAGVVIGRAEIVVAAGQAYEQWRVTTATGRELEASLVSVDPVRGVSLLRPDQPLPTDGPALTFGPPALASGSPVLALLATPSAVVTQLLPAPGTDASLGARLRSGGLAAGTAVVDLDGRLVAFLGTGVRGGLPFTSEDLQNQVLLALRAGAPLPVPWLGADLQDVGPALAHRFPGGLMVVVHLEAGSPAAEAGLLPNDIVSAAAVGDVPVASAAELEGRVEAGRTVTFTVMRGGRRPSTRAATIDVTVGRRRYPVGVDGVSGVQVAETGVPLDVAPASPAARAGLRTGDRVEVIEGRAATADIMARALAEPRGQLLTVRRDGQRRFVVLPSPGAGS
jgi:S1-C subfamily serine protease